MILNCPNCGMPNTDGHRYCSNCGAQVLASKESAPRPPARPQSSVDVPIVADPVSASLRADLSPTASERTAGQATFVPYEGDAIRKIEGQKPNKSWLMPTIYIAGALLVLLIGVTVYLLLTNRTPGPGSQIASNQNVAAAPTSPPVPTFAPLSTSPPLPTAPPVPTSTVEAFFTPGPSALPVEIGLPCALPAGATTEQAIMYRVCRSSEEQIEAWRKLDTEALKGSRTGADLKENIARVEKYKTDKQFADPVLHKLLVTNLKFGPTSALVGTTETWSVTTYDSANKSVVEKKGPTVYSETYHLVLQGDKWLLDKVELVEKGTPTPGD